MVDPNNRITATNALDHPFIQTQPVEFKVFSPRRRFKVCVKKKKNPVHSGQVFVNYLSFHSFLGGGVLRHELP